MRQLICILLILFLSGCANYRSQQYFERDVEVKKQNEQVANIEGRATVYLFREPLLLPTYVPIAAINMAIDERLTATMPVGSYTIHSLEPGVHKFSSVVGFIDPFFPPAIKRTDLELNIEADKVYYVGSSNSLFGKYMRQVNTEEGLKIISKSEQAKWIHNPVTVDTYIERIKKIDADYKLKKATSLSNALPSNEQVKSFLEGLALVAIIAISAMGAPPAQGITYPPAYAHQPSAYYAPRQQQEKKSADFQAQPYPTMRQSNGSLSEIVQSRDRIEVRNLSTSTRYSIEDGKITGSDGSRYRVFGPNVISDTGQTYQVMGNTLYTGDGHSCQKTGSQIICN